MPIHVVLPLVLGISILSLGVAFLLARQRAVRGHRHGRDARDLGRNPRRGGGLSLPPVPHDSDALGSGGGRDLRLLLLQPPGAEHPGDGGGGLLEGHVLVPRRGALLGHRRLHRHVRLDPRQHPHRHRRDDEPQPGAADRAAGRGGFRPRRGRDEPPRRGRALLALRGDAGLPARPPPDRGLRLRGELRRPLRPARRGDLHEGGRRGRRPRGQGGGRASPRTTRATPRSSPTSSATTWATAPAAGPTSSSPPPPRTSGP